jgi:hypothetical protein
VSDVLTFNTHSPQSRLFGILGNQKALVIPKEDKVRDGAVVVTVVAAGFAS